MWAYHNFLSKAECEELVGVAGRIYADQVKDPLVCFHHDFFVSHPTISRALIPETICLHPNASRLFNGDRPPWSVSSSVFRGDEPTVDALEGRFEVDLGLPRGHAHPTQLLSYDPGIRYQRHVDCTGAGAKASKVATVLVYLNGAGDDAVGEAARAGLGPLEGGGTLFPDTVLEVKPEQGMALVFYSMDSQGRACSPKSAHEAQLVTSGRKYVLQKWYDAQDAQGMGAVRMPPPQIMGHQPHQGWVSCDYAGDAHTASCRWYNFYPFVFDVYARLPTHVRMAVAAAIAEERAQALAADHSPRTARTGIGSPTRWVWWVVLGTTGLAIGVQVLWMFGVQKPQGTTARNASKGRSKPETERWRAGKRKRKNAE